MLTLFFPYDCASVDRLGKDALDSALVYTRGRDLHCVGIILLQMLLGLDVVDRYPDAQSALKACAHYFFLTSTQILELTYIVLL